MTRQRIQSPGSPFVAVLREGLAAARRNLVPGLVLQAIGLSLVLCYYFVPATRGAFTAIAGLKASSGLLFGLLATGLFGGLIPFLWQKATIAAARRRGGTAIDAAIDRPWLFLLFAVPFWAWRGVEIDLLYRFQAFIFGATPDAPTIIKKVAVDQFVYNTVWAAHLQYLCYYWADRSFKPNAFSDFDWKRYFSNRVPVTLISTWGVWIPMVSIIYALPSDLQVPLFNAVLCFWVLIMSTIAGSGKGN